AALLFFSGSGLFFKAGRDYRLKEWHHGAKLRTELLDRVLLLALARGEEVRAALLIFCDPRLREDAVENFREDFSHFFACLLGDDALTSRIFALFGRITDVIAHVAEATAVDQVDDELEFVQAFEISDLGLVACFCQRFETSFDQFTDAAAEYGLFAKKVGLG